jgi:hypothetical protein
MRERIGVLPYKPRTKGKTIFKDVELCSAAAWMHFRVFILFTGWIDKD